MPLENSGGEGSQNSHFDKLSLGNEMMNPSSYFNSQFSGATMAYMESMGYLRVKEPRAKMEEVLAWGRNTGCGPLEDNPRCEDIPMTCKYDGEVCSADYFSIGVCSTNHSNVNLQDRFATNCSVF